MALINYVKKEEATGQISEIYTGLEQRIGVLPNVVKFHTASPELFPKLMSLIAHFFDHTTIDPITTAYIRMLVSHQGSGEYCVRFQSTALKYLGVSEKQINRAQENYVNIDLDQKRKALIVFILDIMSDKIDNTEVRIAELKKLGWTEKDIYEASVLGALQKGMVQVIKAFRVEIDF